MQPDEAQGLRDDSLAVPLQRGTNQAGMRAQNERLVLSLVRRHGALAKSEIARMTGLSAQTVSVIMRHLEADRLLRRGEPQRGRVGQPSVPMSLDPEGAYFLGAKVGRRSLDFVLVDFTGGIRHQNRASYPFPLPARNGAADPRRGGAERGAARRAGGADRRARPRHAVRALELGGGDRAAPAELDAWRSADIRAELAADLPWPVYVQNDATAACGAELAFGDNAGLQDFIYFYVGAFVGGGLVLNGGLFAGRTGNAAAIGSMPVPDGAGGSAQLIDVASLVLLERRLRAAGLPLDPIYDPGGDWSGLRAGARRVARHGGARDRPRGGGGLRDHRLRGGGDRRRLPRGGARAADRRRSARELAALDLPGIDPPLLRPGSIGPVARALGGASLPLFDRYLIDQHTLSGVGNRRPREG